MGASSRWVQRFRRNLFVLAGLLAQVGGASEIARGQVYGEPDREQPGDAMIQRYLAAEASKLHGSFLVGVSKVADWEKQRLRYREEYLYMLGLWPEPQRTPLEATVTRTREGRGFVVEHNVARHRGSG